MESTEIGTNGKSEVSSPAVAPKRALVLPGGGGRGAYQVGVAKALKERGIEFDLAFGTSIGALNATLISQGAIQRLEELWTTMRPKDIFRLPSAPHIGSMILGSALGLLDTSPLEELLRREIDLKKLKSSPTRLGFVTTDLCSLETKLVTIDSILSSSELIDGLMATSAVPLAFPPRHLHGKGLWVDGGLVRNTPLQAALNEHASEIFMVLLHPETIDACPTNLFQVLVRCLDILLDASARKEIELANLYNRLIASGAPEAQGMRNVTIHVIQPRKPVNTTLLEIDPERSRFLIKLGYQDALDQLATIYQDRAKNPTVVAS
jgi:NTE family protein